MERYAWIIALGALLVFKYSNLPRPLPSEAPPANAQVRPDEILVWNTLALEAVRGEKLPTTAAARAMAIVHVAMFDALNAIQPRFIPFTFTGRFSPQASIEAALASAAHQVLFELFPQRREHFDQELKVSLARVPEGAAKTEGIRAGVTVGHAIHTNRIRDFEVAAQVAPIPARKKGTPGFWVPTSEAGAFPNWGSLPPFGISDTLTFRPNGPPSLKSKAWAVEVDEVRTIGAMTSTSRTPDQTRIAGFWTTDLVALWNGVTQQIAMRKPQELHERARWFALLNAALADATIVSWDAKAHFFFWDPATAIPFSEFTGNRHVRRDARWQPLMARETSPNYLSEHAVLSGAAATLLALLTETDPIELKIKSPTDPNVERTYPSFSAAALDAAKSRLYAGTHFSCSVKDGLAAGKTISLAIFEHRARTQSLTLAPAR